SARRAGRSRRVAAIAGGAGRWVRASWTPGTCEALRPIYVRAGWQGVAAAFAAPRLLRAVSTGGTGLRYAVDRISNHQDAMAKARTAYVCSECGADFNKWQGQCGECGAWNTLSEIVLESAAATKSP